MHKHTEVTVIKTIRQTLPCLLYRSLWKKVCENAHCFPFRTSCVCETCMPPNHPDKQHFLCYGRLLLHAWLLPNLSTISYNCVRENSLQLSGYGIGFWCTRSPVLILPGPCISAMHLFICFFVTDYVCKISFSHNTFYLIKEKNIITVLKFNSLSANL